MLLRIVAIGALAILAACNSLRYIEPTEGDRARVRFASLSENVAVLYSYEDDHCTTGEQEMMRLRNGPLVRTAPRQLGMPLWDYDQNAAKEVYVSAAKPFYGLILRGDLSGVTFVTKAQPILETSTHGVAFAITLTPGVDYELLFDEKSTLHLYELKMTANGPVRDERPSPAIQNSGCRRALYKPRL